MQHPGLEEPKCRRALLLNTKITNLNILLLEEFGLGKVFRLKLHD